MIIKDSMVLIHLAKITLLEKSCEYFKKIVIGEEVYKEILEGKEKGYPDVEIIEKAIKNMGIDVKKVKDIKLLEKAKNYNLQGGEMESVALYWQEKADYLASDDDNVRKKAAVLNIKLIGTPSIILNLYKYKIIGRDKFVSGVLELKKIGWFNNSVIDKLILETRKDE